MKFFLRIAFPSILIVFLQPAFGQQTAPNNQNGISKTKSRSGEHWSGTIKPRFGEAVGGTITIADHLNDSLSLTEPFINERYRIISFNLSLKCNGNVIKYFENKNGNKLTPEMKQAVQALHPNCTIVFEGITMRSLEKSINGRYDEMKPGMIVLTLK